MSLHEHMWLAPTLTLALSGGGAIAYGPAAQRDLWRFNELGVVPAKAGTHNHRL